MAFSYSPKIVTEGLVLYLDAANPYSYVSGSTSWNDLSRSQTNGTLVNGPTYSSANLGSIVFDGVDDYVDTTYNQQLNDFTIGVWFNANSTSEAAGRLLDKDYINGTWLGKNPVGTVNSWGGGVREVSAPYGIYLTLLDGQWNYLVSIRSGTTHILYGNGITNTISNTVSSTITNPSIVRLGTENTTPGSSFYKGNIASAQIYNRALTAQEVLQNYNATKTRFGLT
jgi:hypothetical protein